jgi:REP element-mobilizing transposase RayT
MFEPKSKQWFAASARPRNPGLLKLIEAKRRWHYQADVAVAQQGFLGWHERGYLPHFDAPHATQFVTFMLHDSFPVVRRQEWEGILHEPSESLRRRKLEAWLDRGYGKCWLRRSDVASRTEEILRADDGRAYCLRAWIVMPNHVHLVVDVLDTPLSKLLSLWKRRSARAANLRLRRTGHFWEREYFDTLVHDAAHLNRAIRYVENNPVKAGLVREPKEWRWSSAWRREEFGRLT